MLYSYSPPFSATDNNVYGLKIFAYLRLAGRPLEHRHVVDASSAPRGQLLDILDEGEVIGDSEAIIAHLESVHGVALDAGLTRAQRGTALLVTRMLDDLYWVMSYSRWKDPAFWPAFHAAMQRQPPELTDALLQQASDDTPSAAISGHWPLRTARRLCVRAGRSRRTGAATPC